MTEQIILDNPERDVDVVIQLSEVFSNPDLKWMEGLLIHLASTGYSEPVTINPKELNEEFYNTLFEFKIRGGAVTIQRKEMTFTDEDQQSEEIFTEGSADPTIEE